MDRQTDDRTKQARALVDRLRQWGAIGVGALAADCRAAANRIAALEGALLKVQNIAYGDSLCGCHRAGAGGSQFCGGAAMTDWTALEQAAQAALAHGKADWRVSTATDDEWWFGKAPPECVVVSPSAEYAVCATNDDGLPIVGDAERARYIALANPSTILALLAELREAQQQKRETFQAGYDWAEQVGDAVKRAEQAEAEAARLREQVRDLSEVLEDKRRLTRELDVAISGPDGAAKQASLCDLIAPAKALREQVQALTERAIVWPAVLRAAIADVWEARDEAAKMRRSWQQADGALDEAAKENDRHIQRIVELEQQVQALQGELAEARRDAENETAHREATHEEYVRACEERDAARAELAEAEAKFARFDKDREIALKKRMAVEAERDAAREALRQAIDAAYDTVPSPAHEGACGPESHCDAICAEAAGRFEQIRKWRSALGQPTEKED